jgi:hypothetical protein
MNQLPPLNLDNVKLASLWVLIVLFSLMAWHFLLRGL